MAGYYRDIVRPKMLAAESDDSLAESTIQDGKAWSRQVDLLRESHGIQDTYLDQKQAEVSDSIIKILQNAFDKTYKRCITENDPGQSVRLWRSSGRPNS